MWYEDGEGGSEQGHLSLGQVRAFIMKYHCQLFEFEMKETTTNTYEGHVFFFTEYDNRNKEVARFTMSPDQVRTMTTLRA